MKEAKDYFAKALLNGWIRGLGHVPDSDAIDELMLAICKTNQEGMHVKAIALVIGELTRADTNLKGVMQRLLIYWATNGKCEVSAKWDLDSSMTGLSSETTKTTSA